MKSSIQSSQVKDGSAHRLKYRDLVKHEAFLTVLFSQGLFLCLKGARENDDEVFDQAVFVQIGPEIPVRKQAAILQAEKKERREILARKKALRLKFPIFYKKEN